jgi:hypothetical protein
VLRRPSIPDWYLPYRQVLSGHNTTYGHLSSSLSASNDDTLDEGDYCTAVDSTIFVALKPDETDSDMKLLWMKISGTCRPACPERHSRQNVGSQRDR